MKVAVFFDKLGKWFPSGGAVFDVIYNAFVNELNKKLDLNFKLVKSSVYDLKETDTGTYGFGAKKYCKPFRQAIDTGEVTLNDVTNIIEYTGKYLKHNMAFDGSKGGYIINTNGKTPAKMKLKLLKWMADLEIIWSPVRTIEPADGRTKQICSFTVKLARAEIKGTIKDLDIIRKDNKYYKEAKLLFYYGR